MSGGRPHFLDQPGSAEAVAFAWIDGKTRQEMCEQFDVTPHTITRWTQDPRVKAKATQFARDRILRVVRKTDNAIEERLRNVSEMTVKDILDVRKEFIHGPGFQEEGESTTPETVNEITEAIENNPDFAKQLQELLERGVPQEG